MTELKILSLSLSLSQSMSMFFALFLMGTNTTFAQSSATNLTEQQKEKINNNVETYATALQLSEAQKPKFKEITIKYAKQMKAVKDSGGSRISKYRKVKSIRKNKDAEMKTLLSKDQYNVYLEKQKEMQKKMKERRKKKG